MSNLIDASLEALLAASNIRPQGPYAAAREFFIHGVTVHGKTFRPSDWAERLCGVMACYRPGGRPPGRDGYIGYSPYVRPVTVGGVKCVVLDERLRDIEPMAFTFVLNFARDNELPLYEGCSLQDAR
jgi:hypothetical protein